MGAGKLPRVLTAAEAQAILDACEHLRDRLLFAVLLDSGCGSVRRSGCGTRIFASPNGELTLIAAGNDNGARAKSASPGGSRSVGS